MNLARQAINVFLTIGCGATIGVNAGEVTPPSSGSVVFLAGKANLEREGKTRPLAKGDPVRAGDRIITAENGHVHLRMNDHGFIGVRPGSSLRIQTYSYNPQNPAENQVKLQLDNGVARTVSGNAGENARDRYRFNTPLAAIGLRGTDYVVQTDAEATRVAVMRGAVVVSPFGQHCSPAQVAPCGGELARELAANQPHAYLEVRAQGGVPVVVPAGNNTPNRLAPPHPEEPRASADKDLTSALAAETLTTVRPPSVTSPNPTTPTAPESRAEIAWGRWSAVATNTPTLVSLVAEDREITYGNPLFGLLRPTGNIEVPTAGKVALNYAAGEAYLQNRSGTLTSVALSQGRLDLNFTDRQFSTSLMAAVPGSPTPLQAQGNITFQGFLIGDSARSNMNVSGVISSKANEAGYLFDTALNADQTLFGATRWKR